MQGELTGPLRPLGGDREVPLLLLPLGHGDGDLHDQLLGGGALVLEPALEARRVGEEAGHQRSAVEVVGAGEEVVLRGILHGAHVAPHEVAVEGEFLVAAAEDHLVAE
ncbi:hypothetical protein D3C83_62080 [compost metagenome]